jgi:Glycosyl transferases group 1
MRVAFLANPEQDYLQDVVFHGLASVLGPEHVVDIPPLDRYHSPPWAERPHPFAQFDFAEPERAPTLRDELAQADAVVIGSLRSGIRALVDEVLATKPRPPVAFVDGEDDWFVRGIRPHVELYFKREIVLRDGASRSREALRRTHRLLRKPFELRDPLADPKSVARAGDCRLLPLLFGWVGPLPQQRPPQYDVTFLAAPANPIRARLRDELARLRAEGVRVRLLEEGERLTWSEYIHVLAQSRIGVSVRGAGYDTYRYWEIPACGALLLAETPRIVVPGNFVDGAEAVFASSDRLAPRVRELLSSDRSASIARRGRERLEAAHLSLHRGRAVLDALDSLG